MDLPRAQLRMFAPLDSFPPGERQRWEEYIAAGGGLTRGEHAKLEARTAVQMLVGDGRFDDSSALVRRYGKRTLLCPLEPGVRAAMSLEQFRRSVPDEVADAFVPQRRLRDALEKLAATRRAPYVLDETWLVPLHWFFAFDPADRRVRDHLEGHGARIVYLTAVEVALPRLERVVAVVTESEHVPEDVVNGVASLAAWVDRFSEGSIVELDYGGVADQFTRDELEGDTTCEDLWRVVEKLERGDGDAAAKAFDVVRHRWGHKWVRQYAN